MAGCSSRRAATPRPGNYYWRITQWMMPWYTIVPPYGHNALNAHAWVPIDDDNCFTWTFTYHPTRPLSDMELDVMRKGGGIHVPVIPGTFRPVINKDNDYKIDREAQKRGETYCGVQGIAMQDAAVQESMGPIQDRTKENLVSTDNAIIMARHRLLRAAQDLQKGIAPPGLAPGHASRALGHLRAAGRCAVRRGQARGPHGREGVAHTSI